MQMEFTKKDITTAAQQVWDFGNQYKVWAFYAQMGSGKTTFISTLCKEILGVKESVSSPTFAIINQYQSAVAGTIYHMDWYRLKNGQEAIQAGVEDALANGDFCLVEWPENALDLLPGICLHIYIEATGSNSRLIKVKQSVV